MTMRSRLSFALICVCLAGCGDAGNSGGSVGAGTPIDFELTDSDKQTYAELQGIPPRAEERIDRTFQTFKQRVQIVKYLVNDELSDNSSPVILAGLEAFTNAVLDKYFEQYFKTNISEQAAKDYYEANTGEFAAKRYHLAHILLKPGLNATEAEREKLKTKANEIVDELRAGADFAAMVERYSDDAASRDNNGDIGWLNSDTGAPPLVQAADSINVGEYSDPVRSRRGFHIVTLLEETESEAKPFETVKPKILYRLRQQAEKQEWERLKSAALGHQ